jgi:hypothetical protein
MTKNLFTLLLVATVALGALVPEVTASAPSATAMAVSERGNPAGGPSQVVVAAVQQPWDVQNDGYNPSNTGQLPQRFAEAGTGVLMTSFGATVGTTVGYAVLGPLGGAIGGFIGTVAGQVFGEWAVSNIFNGARGPYMPRTEPGYVPVP